MLLETSVTGSAEPQVWSAAPTSYQALVQARALRIVTGAQYFSNRQLFARAELDCLDAAGGPLPTNADDPFFTRQLEPQAKPAPPVRPVQIASRWLSGPDQRRKP